MVTPMQKLLIYMAVALALIGVGATGAWMWQANSYGKELAKQDAAHQADLTTISNAAAAQQRTDQATRLALEQRLSDSEQSHYKELSDAQTNQARLRDRLATADLRLSVLLTEGPTGGSSVSAGTAAGGVVHDGARARLNPAHAQRVIGITDAGDQGLIALAACQAYVREVSR